MWKRLKCRCQLYTCSLSPIFHQCWSTGFVNQSQSTNCWAGTFKSCHRWRLMKIAPLLDITSDPVSCVEQKSQAVSSGFPQRAAGAFKRQYVLNLTCCNTYLYLYYIKATSRSLIMMSAIKLEVITKNWSWNMIIFLFCFDEGVHSNVFSDLF